MNIQMNQLKHMLHIFKMCPSKLAVLALLLTAISCLHQHHDLIDYNETQYLLNLQQVESQLRTDFDKIKKQVETVKEKLAKNQSSEFQQIQTLQETFAEERDILSRIEGYLGLPFSLKPCVKTFNLTAYEKKDLNGQLDKIREALTKLKNRAESYPDCVKFEELKKELAREEQYVTLMEGIINGQCRKGPRQFREDNATGSVDLNLSIPISNLGVPNWIYGNITAQEYKYEMFALTSKHNVTKCKPQKPFAVNKTDCIKCPKDKPIWNVGHRACEPCAAKMYFNEEQGRCKKDTAPQEKGVNSNRQALNFIGKRPIVNPKQNTCPADRPYYNGQTCILCNYPLIFNFNVNKCERCPQKTIYSYNLRKCTRPTRVALSSLDQAQNWITNRKWSEAYAEWSKKTKKEGINLCPNNAPYYDEVTCVVCELPKVYNLDLNLCMKVQEGFEFDQNIHRVIRKSNVQYNTRPDSPYLLIEEGVTPPTSTNNLCPVSEPYFDGLACINCEQPKIVFNFKLRMCTKCSPGKIFDPASKGCQQQSTRFMTNLNAQNIILPEDKSLDQYKNQQKTQRQNSLFQTELCPEEAPFYIKSNCVNCPPNLPFFNIQTNSCVNCLANQSFIGSLHRCTTNTWVTNTQAPSLLSNNPQALQSLISKVNSNKNQDIANKIMQCPMRSPYFNGHSCIECQPPNQLFNLDTNSCTNCPSNTVYSSTQRICKKFSYGTLPTAPNLLYNGDFKKYVEEFNTKQKQDESFAGCPQDKPYWNGSACGKCENELLPLFDMAKMKCLKCKPGFNYNPESKKCLYGKVEVNPSIEKSFMNLG